MNLRAAAREIFLEALRRVDVRTAMQRAIKATHNHIVVGGTSYCLDDFDNILVISVGKAALPMAEGLLHVVEPALRSDYTLHGIVIGGALPLVPNSRMLYRFGSHPTPDETSVDAAKIILRLLATATERTLIFFLLSGGASAMIERSLSASITLPDLTTFHKTLVHSGLSITEMNTLRKHLSAVKGGRLATAASRAAKCTLLVSDVPKSRPEVIGSGPSMPDPTTLDDCRLLLANRLSDALIPPSILRFFSGRDAPETPKPDNPAFARGLHQVLLSSDDLAFAAQDAAQARGFCTSVVVLKEDLPYTQASSHLLKALNQLTREHPGLPVCLITSGEISIPVTTPNPGLGGRNQHFALHCALSIADAPWPVAVLSAGSDGIDGNSPAAGAVVDETTLRRASREGLDPAEFLARFNVYPFLQALGDAVIIGPTGNNLRDLRLLLANPGIT